LLKESDICAVQWDLFVDSLYGILTGPVVRSDQAQEFMRWAEPNDALDPQRREQARSLQNIYRHQTARGALDIEVSTIHTVKGETHNATLVLETFHNKVYDVKEAISFILGDVNPSRRSTKTVREQIKRMFVAITRPSEIVCLAVFKDHFGEVERNRLVALGWSILDLTS
jgi:DNA helicase II / ATP-dependent DNA helicase PcrA